MVLRICEKKFVVIPSYSLTILTLILMQLVLDAAYWCYIQNYDFNAKNWQVSPKISEPGSQCTFSTSEWNPRRMTIMGLWFFLVILGNFFSVLLYQGWCFTVYPRLVWTQPKICFYQKIHNFYPIITKLCWNKVFMSTSFWQNFVMIGQKIVEFLI